MSFRSWTMTVQAFRGTMATLSLGSEEAHEVTLTLASVRLSNCTYGFPVCSFRKDFITAEMPEKELA